jgi:hypothetical protein
VTVSLPGEKAEEGEEPVGPVRQKHLLKVGEDLRDQEYRASGFKKKHFISLQSFLSIEEGLF